MSRFTSVCCFWETLGIIYSSVARSFAFACCFAFCFYLLCRLSISSFQFISFCLLRRHFLLSPLLLICKCAYQSLQPVLALHFIIVPTNMLAWIVEIFKMLVILRVSGHYLEQWCAQLRACTLRFLLLLAAQNGTNTFFSSLALWFYYSSLYYFDQRSLTFQKETRTKFSAMLTASGLPTANCILCILLIIIMLHYQGCLQASIHSFPACKGKYHDSGDRNDEKL